MDLRTMLVSGMNTTFPKRHTCLATNWSASGRAEEISKTHWLDALEIMGCGIPQICLKQETWDDLIRKIPLG
eukprot:7200510-Pyramimonas_sp.AAC.1